MKRTVILVLIGFLVWACANTDAANTTENKKTELKMAEWSELALLMRDIHKDAKSWRKAIDNGTFEQDSIAIYKLLVESKPTDEDVEGPVFEGFAQNYQMALDSLMLSKNIDLAKAKYNNLVTACITCHQTYCPGPVKTIRKLYFPEG
ncbi:hypothetical protein G3O08_13220 [Cryomorpha ignava]|uniref:Cytochrome c n=1 Tax=Cryomorpha ignava TaxID=101383 RepID=A0A7K3WUW9_9FLAO|nr:hypothetical protein [Cryomorpha ignava]NEN24465.1 hypothetical protein [Cryomorpha ignava]